MWAWIPGMLSALWRIVVGVGFAQMVVKTVIGSAITLLLSAALYALYIKITSEVFNWVVTYVSNTSTGLPDIAFEFIGIGAYFFDHLRINDCLGLILTATSVSFLLKLLKVKK